VVFRKKEKEEEDLTALTSEQEAELAQLPPGVRHVRRRLMGARNERQHHVIEHLQAVHEPGGLAARKQAADFMELGTPRSFLDALSDLEFTIDEMFVTVLQNAGALWTVTGVQTGELCGIPPTGEPVTIKGITILVMQDKYVLSDYTYWDFPELTRRMSSAATRPAHGA
jgi:predicted ester cyclase